jgi:hypothetical protein
MGRASSVAKRRYPVARDASPGYSEPDAAVRESRSDGICCPQSVHHTHGVASRLMGTRCSFYPGFASWAIACRRFATHWVERHILRTRDSHPGLSHAVASRLIGWSAISYVPGTRVPGYRMPSLRDFGNLKIDQTMGLHPKHETSTQTWDFDQNMGFRLKHWTSAKTRYTFCNLVTRPVDTHSATKMLPSDAKQAS